MKKITHFVTHYLKYDFLQSQPIPYQTGKGVCYNSIILCRQKPITGIITKVFLVQQKVSKSKTKNIYPINVIVYSGFSVYLFLLLSTGLSTATQT